MFSAVKAAKEFAATHAVKLSTKQHAAYVEALARAFADAYNQGYRKGQQDGKGELPYFHEEENE